LEFSYEHNGEVYKVEIIKEKDGFIVKIGDRTFSLMDVLERSEGLLKFQLNRKPVKCQVATSGELRHIFLNGNVFQLKKISKKDVIDAKRTKSGPVKKNGEETGQIQSPINGKIIKVRVSENNKVKANQDLLIIEAMKMEHRIKSPFAGTVKKILIKEGEQVQLGTLLMELEPDSKKNEKEVD
jgi:biotin carboxyl carrier protein